MVVPGQGGHPANPLINLTYTSGSSGRPKGAEYRERVYVEFLQVWFFFLWECMHGMAWCLQTGELNATLCTAAQNPMPGRTFNMATPAILLGFLPLNHLMGRMTLLRVRFLLARLHACTCPTSCPKACLKRSAFAPAGDGDRRADLLHALARPVLLL
jgi:hypothetical protein